MALASGTRLGSYEVLGSIGAGGMGEVYRARDLRLGREVAIKVLPADRLADERRRRRFIQEAQAASSLNHPHIVTIHEIESHGDVDFIVMEHVRGASLDTFIPRHGLRLPDLLRIAIPVADALAAAHDRGIIHRDLKPANVMVGGGNVVKVLDFGLAKLVDDEGEQSEDTQTVTQLAAAGLSAPGAVMGTAAYMAPEQATGGKVDARSDIFSFGAMLYEMATGTRAFAGSSVADTLAAVLRAQPTPPAALVPGVPRELERMILRCLRKEPERRYQTMLDVRNELDQIKEDSDSGLVDPIPRPSPAPRRVWWAAGALAVVAVLIGILVTIPKPPTAGPPPTLLPLTSLQGLESGPTFSPDGEQVAFTWESEKGGTGDVYLKLVGSTELRRLTTDPDDDFAPVWSPDGRLIAFLRDVAKSKSTEVRVVSPITGAERKLADAAGVWQLSWSKDSRRLLTVKGRRDGRLSLIPVEGADAPTTIRAPMPGGLGFAALSPDDAQLAYSTCSSLLHCRLDVIALDGDYQPVGDARNLATLTANIGSIAWSRDGRSVIYTAEALPFMQRLWLVPADTSAPPERLELPGIGAREPAIARGRDRLAFVSARFPVSYHPVDMTMTSPAVLASSYSDLGAEFSPDGRQLVFSSSRSGESVDIWVADADGSRARQLTRGPGSWQGSPAWSPDGRQIAFNTQLSDGSWSIWTTDLSGGPARKVTPGVRDGGIPTWSRDGEWIYFTSAEKTSRRMQRVNVRTGEMQGIADPGAAWPIALSPDGREVYYRPERDDSRVMAVPAEGGAAREVLRCARALSTVPAGVCYLACGPGPVRDVHWIDATTGADRVIGRTESNDAPAVSPDGKTVLVSRQSAFSDLMMIDNFR